MPFLYRLMLGCTLMLILLIGAMKLAHAGGEAYPPPPPPPPPAVAPYPYPPPPGSAVAAAWAACSFDVQRYCPAVPPGQGRIVHCLTYNWWGLTRACRVGLRRVRDALAY